jgi:NADPH-dependent glutamate synthase beta subunit-like oxidoreductase
LTSIKEVVGPDLILETMQLDADGKPQPTGKLESLPADALVLAVGQQSDSGFLRQVPGIEFDADGAVKIGADCMTGHPGIFAGGDMVAGGRSVTASVGQGKHAARCIDAWLRATPLRRPEPAPLATFSMLHLPMYSDPEAQSQRRLAPAARQRGFEEVVSGLTAEEARYEAQRCLSCGVCYECDQCFAACPEQAIVKLGPGHGYRVDLGKCTGCAVCFEQCPCHAIDMRPEPRSGA